MTCMSPGLSIFAPLSRIRLDPDMSFEKKSAIPSGMAGFFLDIGESDHFLYYIGFFEFVHNTQHKGER